MQNSITDGMRINEIRLVAPFREGTHKQEINVVFMKKTPNNPPKLSISIMTTEDKVIKSFRTDRPEDAVNIARAILRASKKMRGIV